MTRRCMRLEGNRGIALMWRRTVGLFQQQSSKPSEWCCVRTSCAERNPSHTAVLRCVVAPDLRTPCQPIRSLRLGRPLKSAGNCLESERQGKMNQLPLALSHLLLCYPLSSPLRHRSCPLWSAGRVLRRGPPDTDRRQSRSPSNESLPLSLTCSRWCAKPWLGHGFTQKRFERLQTNNAPWQWWQCMLSRPTHAPYKGSRTYWKGSPL